MFYPVLPTGKEWPTISSSAHCQHKSITTRQTHSANPHGGAEPTESESPPSPIRPDGSSTTPTDINDYVHHITRLSQQQFHSNLFCLVLYNLNVKQQMVRSVGLKTRRKRIVTASIEELSTENVSHEEADKKARQDAEALTNRFGMPHFFITVTPDDGNSFLVQA